MSHYLTVDDLTEYECAGKAGNEVRKLWCALFRINAAVELGAHAIGAGEGKGWLASLRLKRG